MTGFLTAADVSIVLGSLVLVTVVGLWVGRRRVDTARGYFMADNKMPWYLVGTAFVATGISSEQIVGTVGVTYQHGLGIANWEWFIWPMYTLPLVLFIPLYLKNRVTTVPGFLAARFSPLVGTIYAAILLLVYVGVYLVTVLYGGALVFSQITGWDLRTVVFLAALIVGAYSIKGGLVSVMWTDLVQCVLLTVGGVVLFLVALGKLPGGVGGGWTAMEIAAPDRMHLYQPPGHKLAPFLGMIVAVFGIFTFYQVGNQAMIQRVLAARSTWDGLMGIVMAAFLGFLRPLVTCFLGLVVYHWIVNMRDASPLPDNDLAFTFALRELAPGWGIRGIVIAGFIAAVMSTMSSLVNSISTMFATDFYARFIERDASDRRLVAVGRLSAIAALAIAAAMAPIVARVGIFRYFQTCLNYVACPFMATALMGILWKRVNSPAAVFGLVGGIAIQIGLALLFSGKVRGIPELHFFYVGFIAQVVIAVGIAAVTLRTAPPDAARVEGLVWRLDLLKSYDDGRPRPWYKQVKFWWALFFLGEVLIYWRFW